MISPDTIEVWFDHRTTPGEAPLRLGTLTIQRLRGKERFAFEFSPQWLERNFPCQLDPDLAAWSGLQYTTKASFGFLMDSAPDRWGRRLMQRREALLARAEKRPPRPLAESDYLLGGYDETRMGALRFRVDPQGPFLNHDASLAAPPWARLRELEEAARHMDSPQESDDLHAQWLRLLLAPGSSLGGARPKASVTAPDGSLWLAKFPKKDDDIDTSAWEYLTWRLARTAGLNVPEARLERLSKTGSTFLVKRFDREGPQRLHFASAMTLLGMEDGADAQSGASYLHLAELLTRSGAAPEIDLPELWSRIVFSIAVSNTDDHLRNHGFLYTPQGWRLAPAYDLNPNPQTFGLSLNITEADNALDFDLALQVASLFHLPHAQATARLARIREAVAQWQTLAQALGIPRQEQSLLAGAFRE